MRPPAGDGAPAYVCFVPGYRSYALNFVCSEIFEDPEENNVLKYLWMVTQELFLAVTYVTFMHALLGRLFGRRGRLFHAAAAAAGTAAAMILAAVKLNTRLIVSSHWNHYIYAVYLVVTVLFILFALIRGRKENSTPGAMDFMLMLTGSIYSAVLIFYALPTVLIYPFNFNTMGNGYLSSYYFIRMAGYLLGLILLLIYSVFLDHVVTKVQTCRLMMVFEIIGISTYGINCFGRFFVPWVNRAKWLNWPVKYDADKYGIVGAFMNFTVKYAMYFIWITLILAGLSALIFFCQNLKVKDPYDNPAQKRKLRARNRKNRRTSAAAAVCVICAAFILTLVKSYDTRVIELSAPETYIVEEDRILIPAEEVSDGHLHRFEYQTENGINVRWIVVKKPGSASFGVGLDACDVCGNAGYFERNGQVICKRCDVVMNINTIGFKGGCNPIPLSYEVENGNLVFKIEDIVAGEKEFR